MKTLIRHFVFGLALTFAQQAPAVCFNTAWTSNITEVLQMGLCTAGTCTFTFTESLTGAQVSGTFARPTTGFLTMTVTSQSLGTSSGWAFSGSTLRAIQIPGATMVVQPLIVEDLYNPVIFVTKSCPTKNVRANWIFGHWDPTGLNDLTSSSQPAAGFLDLAGTSNITMNVQGMYDMVNYSNLGTLSLTPSPVACTAGKATISNGAGDRSGTVYFGGSSGLVLYKTSACHSVFGVPQSTIGGINQLTGNYAGFAYDSKEQAGFNSSTSSVHQVKITINATGCTSAAKCTGNGMTDAQGNDGTYMGGSLSIQVNAINSPRTGMFTGYLFDGSSNQGNILCSVYMNMRTTSSTPPFYNNLFCVSQVPNANVDPMNIFLVRVPQAPGAPDTTFTSNGYVVTNVSTGIDGFVHGIQQSDGKFVAVGYSIISSKNVFTIARYLPSGALDTTFGGGDGIATTVVGNRVDRGQGVVQQSDGKLVMVGLAAYQTSPTLKYNLGLVRYDTSGALDTTYGSSGIVNSLPSGFGSAEFSDIKLLANDKVLVVGSCLSSSTNYYGFCAMRYNSDGSLDTTFGSSGLFFLNAAPAGNGMLGLRSKVLANGKILIAGTVAHSTGDYYWGLLRINANGTLDTTFNSGGATPGFNEVNPTAYQDIAYGIDTLSDGSIILGGKKTKVGNSSFIWQIAKFTSAGVFDTSWGSSGYVTTAVGTGGSSGDTLNGVTIQPNDKIMTVGNSYNGTRFQVAAVRYNADGSLDTTFNSTGKYTLTVGSVDASVQTATLLSDGRFFLEGYTSSDAYVMLLWP